MLSRSLGFALLVLVTAGCPEGAKDDATPARPSPPPEPPAPKAVELPTYATAAGAPGPVLVGLEGGGTFRIDEEGLKKITPRVSTELAIGGDGVLYADTTGRKPHDEAPLLTKLGVSQVATSDGAVGILGESLLVPDESFVRKSEFTKTKKVPVPGAKRLSMIAVHPNGDMIVAGLDEAFVRRGDAWDTVKPTELFDYRIPHLRGVAWAGDTPYLHGQTEGGKRQVKSVDGETTIDLPDDFSYRGLDPDNSLHGLPDGRLIVLGRDRIMVVGAEGKKKSTYTTEQWVGGAAHLHDLAVDGQGRIWVASPDAGLLLVDDAGKLSKRWPTASLPGAPIAIAVAGKGPVLPDSPPEEKGTVKGVIEINGKPLANGKLVACFWPDIVFRGKHPCAGELVIFEGETGADGSFEVKDVPHGWFNVAPKDDDGWLTGVKRYLMFTQTADEPLDLGTLKLKVR